MAIAVAVFNRSKEKDYAWIAIAILAAVRIGRWKKGSSTIELGNNGR